MQLPRLDMKENLRYEKWDACSPIITLILFLYIFPDGRRFPWPAAEQCHGFAATWVQGRWGSCCSTCPRVLGSTCWKNDASLSLCSKPHHRACRNLIPFLQGTAVIVIPSGDPSCTCVCCVSWSSNKVRYNEVLIYLSLFFWTLLVIPDKILTYRTLICYPTLKIMLPFVIVKDFRT